MRPTVLALLLLATQDRRVAVLDGRLEQGIKERSPRLAHDAVRELLKIGKGEAIESLLLRAGEAVYAEDSVRLRRYIISDRFWERMMALEENERAGDPKVNSLLEEVREAHKSMHVLVDIRSEIYDGLRQQGAPQEAVVARIKKSKFWLERATLAGLITSPAPLVEQYKIEPEPTVQVAILDALSALKLTPDVSKLLVEALRSEYGSMRLAAIFAMRRFAALEFLDALIPLHADSRGRQAAEIEIVVRELTRQQAPHDPSQWGAWWKEGRERILKNGIQEPGKGPPQTRLADFFTLPLNSIHLAFVIDCSESMKSSAKWDPAVLLGAKGEKLKPDGSRRVDIAEYQLGRAFQSLPENSRFAVILFATGARLFESVPQTLTQDVRKKISEFVAKLPIKGNTDMLAGLDMALSFAARRDGRIVKEGLDTIYLLSDGDPSEGPITGVESLLDEVVYRNRFAKAAIHSIFIGREGQQSQRQFMQDLASRNWGFYARATQ